MPNKHAISIYYIEILLNDDTLALLVKGQIVLVHLSRRLQVHYCDQALSVVRRPSVVVNFSHFRLLLWNHWTEFDETLQEGRSQRPLPSLWFFRADRKNKMAALASDWLKHFRLLLRNRWTEFNETWQEARFWTSFTKFVFFGPIGKTRWPPLTLIGWNIFDFSSETAERKFNETWQEARTQCPLPSLCFSGRSEKQDGRPGLWLAEAFSTSPLKPLNGIQRNLTGSKISMSSTKFVFFGQIGKTRWPPWPLIGWNISDFYSVTAERNSTKLDRKQDLNVLYQVCVFRANRKNKMAALASDWLRHFRLLLWNRWTEFNETWQEARSQRPLPCLCFSGLSEKQDGRLGLWLAETFPTSPLKPLERNSTKLDRKQDLNVLYQVCVFRAHWKNKMAALASDWLRHFRLLLWNRWTEIQRNLTGSKISMSSTKFVFFGPIEKKMATLANPPKRWHIVLRCTICGPLGLLLSQFLNLEIHISNLYCVIYDTSSFTGKRKRSYSVIWQKPLY